MFVASVGRGDAGPFRRGGTVVGQGVVALVAIGDGADAEHAHRARSSSGGSEMPHGMGHRTRQRTIAIAMVIIVTSASLRRRSAQRARGRRRQRAARPRAGLRGHNVGPSGCCEASVRRRCEAPRQTRWRSRSRDSHGFERERRSREARRRDARDGRGARKGKSRSPPKQRPARRVRRNLRLA